MREMESAWISRVDYFSQSNEINGLAKDALHAYPRVPPAHIQVWCNEAGFPRPHHFDTSDLDTGRLQTLKSLDQFIAPWIDELIQFLALPQFRTENRFPLFLELL